MSGQQLDPQSAAYRLAGPDDWAQHDLAGLVEQGELIPVDPDAPVRTVADWEAENWDADRAGPKTVAEAIAAAQDRGDDPTPYRELSGTDDGGLTWAT